MTAAIGAVIVLVFALLLGPAGCDRLQSPAQPPEEAAPAIGSAPVDAPGLPPHVGQETVQEVEFCVVETEKGHYDGPCQRIEWGSPGFAVRREDGAPFVDGITEVIVEVDRPGEVAGASYRRGADGDLIPTGPLTYRDDCACWVRRNFRVGAMPWQ